MAGGEGKLKLKRAAGRGGQVVVWGECADIGARRLLEPRVGVQLQGH